VELTYRHRLPNVSLLVATWIGVFAYVVLSVGAIFTVVYAMKAFREQSEEVRLLQDRTQRDIEQRRRDQASKVFVSVEPRPFEDDPADMRDAACLHNTSPRPIYDIVLGLGETVEQSRPVLLPGDQFVLTGPGTAFPSDAHEVWATFRDSAGVRWRTAADGQLTERARLRPATSDSEPSTAVSPEPTPSRHHRVRLQLVGTAAVLLLAVGSGVITATVLTGHPPARHPPAGMAATTEPGFRDDPSDLLGHLACSLAGEVVKNPGGPTSNIVNNIYNAAPRSTNADIRQAGQAFQAATNQIWASAFAGPRTHFGPDELQRETDAVGAFWDVCLDVGYSIS